MAVIKLDDQTAGRTYVAKITRDSDGYMWNGVSAFVAENTLTDAQQATAVGLATTDPVVSGTGTHSHYIFTTPAGITVPCHIGLYLTSYTVGTKEAYEADYDPTDQQILEDTGTTLPATLTTIDDFLDTEMAAVLAAVDTEVAAIKLKTDLIPASPAAVGSAMVVSDKTGFSLAATGLDAISATPVANPTTWPQRIMWFVQRFFYSSKTPTELVTKDSAGATLTTQAITDDGAGTETLGPPV